MPQLDKVTFLSQYFWLVVIFFGFYLIVLKSFLPKMSRILKYRKEKLNASQQSMVETEQEKKKVSISYETLMKQGLNTSLAVLQKSSRESKNWLQTKLATANRTHYQLTNKKYLECLGEISISQNLMLNITNTESTGKIFLSLLLTKIRHLNLSLTKPLIKKNIFLTKVFIKQSKKLKTCQPKSALNQKTIKISKK
jgi:hypothetical protein